MVWTVANSLCLPHSRTASNNIIQNSSTYATETKRNVSVKQIFWTSTFLIDVLFHSLLWQYGIFVHIFLRENMLFSCLNQKKNVQIQWIFQKVFFLLKKNFSIQIEKHRRKMIQKHTFWMEKKTLILIECESWKMHHRINVWTKKMLIVNTFQQS